jgi:hypothetical protein
MAASPQGKWGLRLTAFGGVATQSLLGVTGADPQYLTQSQYGTGLFLRKGDWMTGLQYSTIPFTKLKFTLSSGGEGRYELSFTRIQFIMGAVLERWRVGLLVGTDTSDWKGAPELGFKKVNYVHIGFQAAVNLTRWFFLQVSLISHPERKYEFTNYPSDTVTVKPGFESSLSAGVWFGY